MKIIEVLTKRKDTLFGCVCCFQMINCEMGRFVLQKS